jgi:hypothetical protein
MRHSRTTNPSPSDILRRTFKKWLERRRVIRKLKAYRDNPPVRIIGGLEIRDTYSVMEIVDIVMPVGTIEYATGEFINRLIYLLTD